MTDDLMMLVYAAGLTWLLIMVAAVGAGRMWQGLALAASNHEDMPSTQGWADRAQRASANLKENMLLFTILVLVAHAAGVANEMTAMGATVFVWARAAHAATYIAGITWVRTAFYLAGLAGLVIILLEILK